MSGWTKNSRLDPSGLAVVKSTIVRRCLTAVDSPSSAMWAPGRAVSVVATRLHRRLSLRDG